MYARWLVIVVVLVTPLAADEYLEEMQQQCYKTRKAVACAKYNLFDSIDKYNVDNVNITNDSTVRLISMTGANAEDDMKSMNDTPIFPRARHLSADGEFSKISKFFTRQAGKFFTHHGLVVELPEEAVVMQEGRKLGEGVVPRKKKNNKELILPILILFKLFKVKILVAISLVGIFFIKKTILLAAFFLPSIINSIKTHCKMPHQYHVVPYHTEEEHYHHDHEHQDAPSGEYGISGYESEHHPWKAHHKKIFT